MLNYDALRDEQLITLIADGEKDALEAYYNRHASSVFFVGEVHAEGAQSSPGSDSGHIPKPLAQGF